MMADGGTPTTLIYLFALVNLLLVDVSTSLNVTILHTNDIHGRFEQFDSNSVDCSSENAGAGRCFGGVARRLTVINEVRAERGSNVLLLDGGDQFIGTSWFLHYRGEASAYFMNKLNYDAMVSNILVGLLILRTRTLVLLRGNVCLLS